MPEGPEVRCVVDELNSFLPNSCSILNFHAFSNKIVGLENLILPLRFEKILCRGKQMFFIFTNGQCLMSHFNMSGAWLLSHDFSSTVDGKNNWLSLLIGRDSGSAISNNKYFSLPAIIPPLESVGSQGSQGSQESQGSQGSQEGDPSAPSSGGPSTPSSGSPSTPSSGGPSAPQHFHLNFMASLFGSVKYEADWVQAWYKLPPDLISGEVDEANFKMTALKHKGLTLTNLLLGNYWGGIGNYLRCEILYWARLSGFRLVNSLSEEDLHRLYHTVMHVILDSYHNGGYSGGKYFGPFLQPGRYRVAVYKQKFDPYLNEVKYEKGVKGGPRPNHWVPSLQV